MKMVTPKQTRNCIKRIRLNIHRLQTALNEAHRLDIIKYENGQYNEFSPCKALQDVRDRVKNTTKEACYNAFINEIKQSEF